VRFAIVVPVKQLNNYVYESIDHFCSLSYKNWQLVIVANDKEQLECSDPRVSLISSGKVTPGEKRNLGALHQWRYLSIF
jgi:hypothetical protein